MDQWAGLLWRHNDFECVIQGYGRETPDTVLPVPEHRESVAVAVACAEVCVALVHRVAHMSQGEREDLLHLEGGKERTCRGFYSSLNIRGSFIAQEDFIRPIIITIKTIKTQ